MRGDLRDDEKGSTNSDTGREGSQLPPQAAAMLGLSDVLNLQGKGVGEWMGKNMTILAITDKERSWEYKFHRI